MSLIGSALLHTLHILYFLIDYFGTLSRSLFSTSPQPLRAPRRQLPNHLAIVLVTGEKDQEETEAKVLIESVRRAVEWCQGLGIHTLSIYDRHGRLQRLSDRIRTIVAPSIDTFAEPDCNSDSDIEYPLTPPASDSSDSRSRSPDPEGGRAANPVITMHISSNPTDKSKLKAKGKRSTVRRRRSQASISETQHNTPPLQLSLLSYEASKPCMAAICRSCAQSHQLSQRYGEGEEDFQLSIDALDQLIQKTFGPSSPDLMIIHEMRPKGTSRSPLELEGYPPWQLRLTEFHRSVSSPSSPWRWLWAKANTGSAVPLQEFTFRQALDEFSAAEMRLGK